MKPTLPIELPEGELDVVFDGAPLSSEALAAFANTGVDVDVTDGARREHGRDWWPLTIGWIHHGRLPALPGLVARPRNAREVAAVLSVANEFGVAVTPQAGRSGVVGGAVPHSGGVALDLTGLNEIHELDDVSGLVTVDAGVFGPTLEAFLNERGFTVGHFPQSFALATVGGWLACRGAGQLSNRYGKIEDIVRGLDVVLADGTLIHTGGRAPRSAVGPDLTQLFVGSEGTLGVIVRATLVVRKIAPYRRESAFSFASIPQGLAACRDLLQRDAHPAVLRLYDHAESKRNFEVDGCVLIVMDEGEPSYVDATMALVDSACASARRESDDLVRRWFEHRNDVSALTPLWQRDVVVDTIEIAGSWADLDALYDGVTKALLAVPGVMIATVHQSHAYVDGACLYFTFAGRTDGDTADLYRAAWDAASRAVLAAGGALSHHHGVGRNRARFVPDALGSSYEVLVHMKDALDPKHVLNPGVLSLGGAPW